MYEYKGLEYDIAPEMLAGAEMYCSTIKDEAQREKMFLSLLGKGKTLTKQAGKDERTQLLEAKLAAIKADELFQAYAESMAQEFAEAGHIAEAYKLEVGFAPKPKRNGEGYMGTLPLDTADLVTLYEKFGEIDAKVRKDDKGMPYLYVECDAPDLDEAYVGFKKDRARAREYMDAFLKDVSGITYGVTETGEPYVKEAGSRSTGEKKESTAPKGARIWAVANGKRYEGANREVFEGMKADGVQFSASAVPASIQNGQVSKKLVSEWGFLPD